MEHKNAVIEMEFMKTDNTTPGHDPSKKYEGTLSPQNPSLQLILYTVTGVLVIVAVNLFYYYKITHP